MRLVEEMEEKGNPAPLVWFFKSKLNQAYDFYLERVDPDYEKWEKAMKK